MTDSANSTTAPSPAEARPYDEVLADAVRVLTEAARLRRPVLEQDGTGRWVPGERTEPADWAEFVTLAAAGAAANIGGVEKVLRGRPGSWEADSVRQMLLSTVGEDPAELARHRTEPLHVTLYPSQYLVDLGYDAVYEESLRILRVAQRQLLWRYELTQSSESSEDLAWLPVVDEDQPADADVPAYTGPVEDGMTPGTILQVLRRPGTPDEAESDRLYDLEVAVEDLQYEGDPAAYGAALRDAVLARAGELVPQVEVRVDVALDDDPAASAAGEWAEDWYASWETVLVDAARLHTPLPWSGLSPSDYPILAADVVQVEAAAGRLPHHRLETARSSTSSGGRVEGDTAGLGHEEGGPQ